MLNIYAVANQKGGVGKSTTCQNLAAGLSDRGKKILLIDLDPQSNLSIVCNARTDAQQKDTITMLEVLTNENSINEGIQHLEKFDIVPSSMFLASIDSRLIDPISRPYKLQEAIKRLSQKYDYIIIDTPPALGTLTANAIIAANYVLIPAQADILSLQGVSQLYATIKASQEHCNHNLKISGIVLTRFNERTRLSRDMLLLFNNAATQMSTTILNQKIREATSIKEAQASGKDIFSYAPNSNATKDYSSLIDELLDKEK